MLRYAGGCLPASRAKGGLRRGKFGPLPALCLPLLVIGYLDDLPWFWELNDPETDKIQSQINNNNNT